MNLEDLKTKLKPTPQAWLDQLAAREPQPPLAPRAEWDNNLTKVILETPDEELFASGAGGRQAADLLRCGLLLWNDALDPSHTLSQGIHSPTGSYWHGIMHRREPDFGNSKYWFRKVGDHPAFHGLRESAAALLRNFGDGYSQTWKSRLEVQPWDPFDFIDRCEKAVQGKEPPEVVELLESIQLIEIQNLLSNSIRSEGANK